MGRTLSRDELRTLLDQVTRDITNEAGVVLRPLDGGEQAPGEDLYTVYITFNRRINSRLALCAGMSLFVRLARNITMMEDISPQDAEDVAKEYFNVLCGHILARLFPVTKVPARFSVPAFCPGQQVMEGFSENIILNFTSDQRERVQLTHYIPCSPPADAALE